MKNDNKSYLKTKFLFFMQSFLPLFVLLLIRHFKCGLTVKFLRGLLRGDFSVFGKAFSSSGIWGMLVVAISFSWILITLLYMHAFKKMQTAGFRSRGEMIEEINYHDDVGLNFFVSYLLPLIMDIDGWQDFFVFAGILILIFIMVWRSNLYYENPALTIWNYRTFNFKLNTGESGIGITRGKKINMNQKIKRKQIIDNLYFIYNVPCVGKDPSKQTAR